MNIGCFTVTALERGRWRVLNTLTGVEHVTYGTQDEVKTQLEKQSDHWVATKTGEKYAPTRINAWGNRLPYKNGRER